MAIFGNISWNPLYCIRTKISLIVCGIAFLAKGNEMSNNVAQRELVLQRMLHAQKSRGPDHMGIYSNDKISIGHVLLKILPDPNSSQPMLSFNKRAVISFNGEIYNFPKLRAELKSTGITFRTNTDTEVILEGYIKYGIRFLKSLIGMFALVIYDIAEGKTILARDRFGQKPLYFKKENNALIAASTIRSLLQYENTIKINDSAIPYYFTFGQTPNSQTLIKGIEHVPSGTVITYNAQFDKIDEQTIRPKSFIKNQQIEKSHQEFSELFFSVLGEMSSTLNTAAAHLSGGLDSGCICAGLTKLNGLSLDTYSCRFFMDSRGKMPDEQHFDETLHQELIVSHIETQNTVLSIRPIDYLTGIYDLVMSMEEPKGNPSIPHYLLAKKIAQKHKIVFSGEGADELFGGYTWKLWGNSNENESEYLNNVLSKISFIKDSYERDVFMSNLSAYSQVKDYIFGHFKRQGKIGKVQDMLEFDIKHFLHYLLLQADKFYAGMGVEGRYPFLNDKIVDFALSQNLASMSDANIYKGKQFIRNLGKQLLPKPIASAKKIGFIPPEGGYYRSELFSLTRSFLLSGTSNVSQIVGRPQLERLLDQHQSGAHNYRKLIWAMLSYEIWSQNLSELAN